jgi:hypothetical protein
MRNFLRCDLEASNFLFSVSTTRIQPRIGKEKWNEITRQGFDLIFSNKVQPCFGMFECRNRSPHKATTEIMPPVMNIPSIIYRVLRSQKSGSRPRREGTSGKQPIRLQSVSILTSAPLFDFIFLKRAGRGQTEKIG